MKRNLLWVSAYARFGSHASRWRLTSPYFCRRYYRQKRESDPLRILFCGTDEFSINSLRALHEYAGLRNSNILSIDVVTKTDKRTGRKLKIIKPPAIKFVARELGLRLHQIDTFTGWNPPEYNGHENPYINLIIAVSFGLLIPPRILSKSKYNGLNIHPSILPDLRGPAPIQWTIIRGQTRTGVSLQTLHPTRFDEGQILDQTPTPGLTIAHPDEITTEELTDLLAPIGAKMLVNAIEERLYVPPYRPIQPHSKDSSSITYAPKITSDLGAIDFDAFTLTEILRLGRAIKPLYGLVKSELGSDRESRIIFGTDIRRTRLGDVAEDVKTVADSIPIGVPYAIVGVDDNVSESSQPLIVNTLPSTLEEEHRLVLPTVTVSSMRTGPGAAAAARAKFFTSPVIVGEHKLYRMMHPLSAR